MIDALRRAVAAAPDDLALRLHPAEVLARAGRHAEAVSGARGRARHGWFASYCGATG